MKTLILILICLCFLPIDQQGKDYFILGNNNNVPDLIYPSYVQEGPDGNIYAYDQKDAFIKVFSNTGTLLKKIGGKGEGPGFFKRTSDVTIGFTYDKKLFFTEFFTGHKWITILKLNYSLDKTITPEINSKFYGTGFTASLMDGSFLVEISFPGKTVNKGKYYIYSSPCTLFHMSANGKIISKIKESDYFTRISSIRDGGDLSLPFTPGFIWKPFKKDLIIFTDGLNPILKIIDYKGKEIGQIKLDIPDRGKVETKDLDNWREYYKDLFSDTPQGREWFKTFGKVLNEYKSSIYSQKPCIENLWITPDGNILIKCPPDENKTSEYRLFDVKGKLLSKIVSDATLITISRKFIFLEKTDSEENTLIYCYNRKKSESEDLLNNAKISD